jgi:predicted phage terminase large subunit-like protein
MVVEIPIEGQVYGLDLYSFARKILGYSRLRVDPHFDWCYKLDQYRHKRSLWLEPRHTYKSTVFTKAYPIWRLWREPNLRILIVNATAANAEAFLAEIVGHYLRNQKLLELYRHFNVLEPLDRQSAKKKSIILTTRTKNFAEPSIGTIGALGNLVSAHYDLIIVDDLCNIDDRESPTIREKKKRWYQDLVSILVPDGELVVVGTHWHFDDVYSFIINELNPQLPETARYYIQRESCYTDDGSPRFPRILTPEFLAAMKIEKGLPLFSCQYLNQPIPAEHQIFKLELMHKVRKSTIDLEEAEAFAFCDPSLGGTDYTAIVTVLKQDDRWTVFHCDLSRSRHSKLIEKLIELHRFFTYKVVGIEANSLGKAKTDTELSNFELVLRDRQRAAGVTVPYKLVWHHERTKHARIESIEPYYSNGQLQFLDSWYLDYPDLMEQLIHFPLAAHDDGPDALAGAVALITEYTSRETATKEVLYPRAR